MRQWPRLVAAGDRAGLLAMLLAVSSASFLPLCLLLGGGDASPFLFSFLVGLGATLGYLAMLLAGWWWLLVDPAFWRLVARRLCSRWMAVGAAGNPSHALLGWSSGFLGVPAASVLHQAWPLFALLLTGLLFRSEGRFQRLDGRLAFLLLLGLGGVGMVVSGQVGELWFVSAGFAWSLAPGVTLALLSGAEHRDGHGGTVARGPGVCGKPLLHFQSAVECPAVLASDSKPLGHRKPGILGAGRVLQGRRKPDKNWELTGKPGGSSPYGPQPAAPGPDLQSLDQSQTQTGRLGQ